MSYDLLFSPIKIGNAEIKNRLVMSPMGTLLNEPGGCVGERAYRYYEARAKGGIGLLCTEICRYNDAEGASAWTQMSMADDRYIEPFRKLADMIHSYGAKIFVQLHHPGRQNQQAMVLTNPLLLKTSKIYPGVWDQIYKTEIKRDFHDPNEKEIRMNRLLPPLRSASAIPADLGMSHTKGQYVKALSKREIASLVRQHTDAAERVMKAGGDGIIIHAASGYLVQQFLSPHTNWREEEYGGSFEGRLRFLRELVNGVRERCGRNFPISVRLCIDECYDTIGYPGEGITPELGIELAQAVAKMDVDALDVTTGTYETFQTVVEPISFSPLWKKEKVRHVYEAVKEVADIPVTAVNTVRRPEQAKELLADHVQDMVSIGRATLVDPEWANKAAEGRENDIIHCISCMNCFVSQEGNALKNEPFDCSMNPRCGRENIYSEYGEKDGNKRTVIVVGAGPAGLTAARELARRDFRTIVLEKNSYAGGQMFLASRPPHREKMLSGIEDLDHQARLAGAEIRYDTEATADAIMALEPYAVFICTGGRNMIPNLPGVDGKNVYGREQILTGEVKPKGKNIIVVGAGITGLEIAELLTENAEDKNHVTVVDMADEAAKGEYRVHRWELIPELQKRNVVFRLGCKLKSIDAHGVTAEQVSDGRTVQIDGDTVVLAMGVRPVNELAAELSGKVRHTVIGDADHAGRIMMATKAAFKAARELI